MTPRPAGREQGTPVGADPSERPLRVRVFALDTACCALGAMLHEEADIVWVAQPRDADVLVVAGSVSAKAAAELRADYDEMPRPKRVLAVGTCARDGGAFGPYPGIVGGAGAVVPVDGTVPGCPPSPRAFRSALAEMADSIAHGGRQGHESRRG